MHLSFHALLKESLPDQEVCQSSICTLSRYCSCVVFEAVSVVWSIFCQVKQIVDSPVGYVLLSNTLLCVNFCRDASMGWQ